MQFSQHLAASAAGLALLVLALPAQAHICLEAPVSRVGPSCTSASAQKPGPCGINTRSTQYVTEFKPGETITVTLNETINHDSHYRIAFNPNGSSFEDPTSKDDKDGKHPFVLLDGIMDESAARQSIKVTLPNVTCDNCTLQLIQVMYDKTANGFGNDDIYYACADIVIKGGAGDVAPGDGGSGAPRPAVDASTSQEPLVPPDAPKDASMPGNIGADAGSGSGASSDAGRTSSDGTADASATASDTSEDEDDGGCSLTRAAHERHAGALALFGTFATFIRRRRRRG